MFASAPLGAVYVGLNVQAHLSAFSSPELSYQASRSGSVTASSSSCETTLAIASPPPPPLGPVEWSAHVFIHNVAGSPTNEYLMSARLIVPLVCQPQ